jgi:hypothetical protein
MADHEVRVRSWVRASGDDIRTGLLGFIGVEYGPWMFDGICLRRTATGKFALSFPAGADRSGRKRSYIRPTDDNARKAIEREVLAQLGQREDFGVVTKEGES